MQKFIVANWKMNGTLDEAKIRSAAIKAGADTGATVILCPPYVHLPAVIEAVRGGAIAVGGQDCHGDKSGAFTGSISAPMLAELGCAYVIVGHSERRHGLNETDEMVKAKATAALAAGLIPILCIGETLAEREAGQAKVVVQRQLAGSLPEGEVILAYEPVWAIGTGRNATTADVAAMHAHIKAMAPGRPVLYGGSVKPGNAEEIMALADVDGVLVGGASLIASDFLSIIAAA